MTNNIRSKNSRHRGSFTHGHGEKKKRRGAGHRGGRGNAGSGKRGDAKKPSYWKDTKYMGKHGFTNPSTKDVTAISIAQLNSSIDQFVAQGVAKKEQSKFTIDLTTAKFNKLLGTGKPVAAYVITVASATAGAIEKIKAAGGDVIIVVKEAKPVAVSSESVTDKPKAEKQKPAKDSVKPKPVKKAEAKSEAPTVELQNADEPKAD